MSGPQRLKQDAATGAVLAADDGPLVLFADVEEALRSTDRLAWLLPTLDGSDEEAATRRTAALADGLRYGLTGNTLVDVAMAYCPK